MYLKSGPIQKAYYTINSERGVLQLPVHACYQAVSVLLHTSAPVCLISFQVCSCSSAWSGHVPPRSRTQLHAASVVICHLPPRATMCLVSPFRSLCLTVCPCPSPAAEEAGTALLDEGYQGDLQLQDAVTGRRWTVNTK